MPSPLTALNPKTACASTKCPDELTGRNSVNPCTAASTAICNASVIPAPLSFRSA